MDFYEIEACVIEAKKGHQEDIVKLIEQFKPFIIKTAKQFNIKNYDIFDLMQIGYIAIINAVNKYITGSNTFSSYAYNSIKNAFRYTARQNNSIEKEISLNIPASSEENSQMTLIDLIESLDNLEQDIVNSEEIIEVQKAVSSLTEEEIELINMIYYNKYTIKAYAEKKGLSYLQAIRRKNKVLAKLSCNLIQ